ncbi:MAG: anti-anti-sigma factor [Roseiflexus castenholzii]|uniref:STAS domain-containing protein n=1 Tax=Roseiflexus castenholzii TaxID=120962 RepID=UPI000CC34812|nr:MAG: anti-anti-sigma factor [Roseiflexus castenholzii]
MTHLFATLTSVAARNPDDQRRGRILVSLSFGVVALLLSVGMVLTLLQPSVGRFVNLGLAVLVFAAAAVLGKKGFVTAGAYVLIVVSGIGALSGVFLNPNSSFNTFYLLISVLLSSVLLPPRQIWVVLGICLAAVAGVLVRVPAETRTAINLDLASAHLTILLVVSAFISFIGARSLSSALKDADESRRRAEEANRQLEVANATLEARVEERTAAYRRLADEQRAVVAQLEESLRAQQSLNQIITELTVPVIPVRYDTLVIPLIGSIDSHRVQHLLASALHSIEQTRARMLIIDVTGVAIIDSHVAAALLQVAQAARLMGAETILAGIRPEVAQTLVSLGAGLHEMRTAATLEAALSLTTNGRDAR